MSSGLKDRLREFFLWVLMQHGGAAWMFLFESNNFDTRVFFANRSLTPAEHVRAAGTYKAGITRVRTRKRLFEGARQKRVCFTLLFDMGRIGWDPYLFALTIVHEATHVRDLIRTGTTDEDHPTYQEELFRVKVSREAVRKKYHETVGLDLIQFMREPER
jgi:hypothetical protein